MSHPTPSGHPDELLAGYVDGSASPEERAEVERHIATCTRCTAEVALAGEARTVLRTLPQLAAPGLELPDLQVVTPITKARRWDRIGWAAGLAAAAAIVVIFALSSTHHPSQTTAGGASNSPAVGQARGPVPGRFPGIVDNGTDYTAQSLSSLASRLVAGKGALTAEPAPGVQGANDLAAEASILTCLQQGAGLDASAAPTYLEIATYQGTPVYVGAFVTPPAAAPGSKSHLLVVAVTRAGCQPVTVLRQPL